VPHLTEFGISAAIYTRNESLLVYNVADLPLNSVRADVKCSVQRSRGGVKFPTGGVGSNASARERTAMLVVVSRFGVIPKPTV